MRKKKGDINVGPVISGRAVLYRPKHGTSSGSQSTYQGICQDGWKGVRNLGNQILLSCCHIVLLILWVISDLALVGILALSQEWMRHRQRLRKVTPNKKRIVLLRKKAWVEGNEKEETPESEPGRPGSQVRKEGEKPQNGLGPGIKGARGRAPQKRQQIRIIIVRVRIQGIHRKTSPLKRKSPSLEKITTPPALRNTFHTISNNSSSSTQQPKPTTPDLSPTIIGSTGAIPDPVNLPSNITVLRTVIPTPASAGIVFKWPESNAIGR